MQTFSKESPSVVMPHAAKRCCANLRTPNLSFLRLGPIFDRPFFVGVILKAAIISYLITPSQVLEILRRSLHWACQPVQDRET